MQALSVLNHQEKKIVTLAALGGMLEFYDFIVYGVFSVYFAHQFFPSHNQFIIIIQSYLIFVLGYIARPIGGIVFSHIGDEYGRKKVLVLTIVLMGLSSLGIGLLPTYASIGIYAPILLLILRVIQGLALGGELPSTFVYISESIPHKSGIAFGLTMSGVNAGLLLGMMMNYFLNAIMTVEQLNRYGWRLPFILGGLVCIISYRIRKTLHETAEFSKIHDRPKLPLMYLLKNNFRECMAGTAFIALMAGSVVAAVIFMPTYLQNVLKLSSKMVSNAMIIIMIINVVAIFWMGKLAQKIQPYTLLRTLVVLSCIFVPLSYAALYFHYYYLGLITLTLLEGGAATLTPLIITRLFAAPVRLTGVSLCYNVGFTVFGALAPLIITRAIEEGHNIYLTPMVYLLVMSIITGIGVRYVNKYSALPLT